MPRAPLKFRESDVRRAIRAAHKEAATIGSVAVEIDPATGNIRIVPMEALTTPPEPQEANPWDK